ncbi:MAG: ABC transporter ATP-binding protein [Fimbriimonadia bacterium]|nr:ABC transporter ATP-binding protein [Fimbriimonadia bacterium]
MLEVQKLRKEYGSLVAVQGMEFQLEPGDVFGFIGPNGAGKTTTIKMLATLLEPTSGTASLNGIDVTKYPEEVRPLLGYMPDFFGLYEGITVREYLAFFAAAYRLPKHDREQVIDNVLELTDLTVKKEAFVETLSRGMQQRLCLAKCLVHDPVLLLLDEPASGLDPRARIEIKELIKELGAMGKIVLVSSHILPELADFCNKIGIVEKGELLVWGPVQEIVKQLQPARILEIKVIGEQEPLLQRLESEPGITDLKLNNGALELHYQGDLEEQADLLSALIRDGFRIASFTETSLDLEDVFMRVTKGIVS